MKTTTNKPQHELNGNTVLETLTIILAVYGHTFSKTHQAMIDNEIKKLVK